VGNTHLRSDLREHGEITASITNIQTTNLDVATGNLIIGNIETLNATDAYIQTLNATYVNVAASVVVGNVASNVTIGKYTGVRLHGIQAWDDLRFPVSAVQKNLGTSKPDTITLFGSFVVLGFDNAASEGVTFAAQMPHSWLQGSDIEAHVHWAPTDGSAGGVRWQMDYSWANISDSFPALATIGATGAAASDNTHIYTNMGEIDATGKTFSSMILCKLIRNVTHADDDYGADAALLEVDFHYRLDGFGSEEELAKAQTA
jgi:hypothetical protein